MLHELRVGAIINDILSEHRGGKDGVNLLGVDVTKLAIQDEVVALGSDVDGRLLAKQDEGENIAVLQRWVNGHSQWAEDERTREPHLCPVLLEEARGVHAIGDGAADDGEPVEDKGARSDS